jgi:hypothetical protein
MKPDPIGKSLLIACVLSMLMAVGSFYTDRTACMASLSRTASSDAATHARSNQSPEIPFRSG